MMVCSVQVVHAKATEEVCKTATRNIMCILMICQSAPPMADIWTSQHMFRPCVCW